MSTPAAATPTGAVRFRFLDAMRGVAALWVVLYHMLEGHHLTALEAALPRPLLALLAYGYLGVPIFFVISGFVIAHSVGIERVTAGFVGRFVARRSLRLDPPYWASMAFFLALQWLSIRFVAGKQAAYPDAQTVFAHLFYLQGILDRPAINTVYWTLCLEVQFYLSYVLLLGLAQRTGTGQPRPTILLLAAAATLASLPGLFGALTPAATIVWFPGLWYGFLLGVCTYWSYRALLDVRIWAGYVALVALAGLMRSDPFALAAAATAVAFHFLTRGSPIAWLFESRWLQHLGKISYSLYLVHNPFTGAFYAVAYRITGRSVALEAAWFLPAVLANVAAASVLWWLIERPSASLSSRLFARPKPATPSGSDADA
jgi:peptidoglycan/LPS O-acetylase OafA/YrhL